MLFQTYGDRRNPAVLFFHAMGVTGASSEPIARYLQDRYFCILPTSTVYCEGQKYVSKLDEIRQVEDFLHRQGVERLAMVVASSIGADLAMAFLTQTKLPVEHAFFDGGQFAQIGKGTRRIMTPFLYFAIKSLYWSKGGTLKKILWCDDDSIKSYFIDAGKNLTYTNLRRQILDSLVDKTFPALSEELQKHLYFEFGSIEDHFKYRQAVIEAYPCGNYPVFVYPNLYRDETAVRLIDQIDYDFSEAEKNSRSLMQRFGALEVAMRQNDLAFEVQAYLKNHPCAAVVNLGCGLDNTGRACDNGRCKIYNLDFPDVIALRQQLLPAGEREQNIPCNLKDPAWFDKIDASGGAVFFASGVFYYFLTEQVRELVQGMADAFPGGVLVFDAANRTAVKMIAKTWLRTAKIKDVGAYFAVSDAKSELSPWDSRLQVSSRGYMMGYNDLKDASVSGFFRFLAKVGDNGMKMQIVKIGFGGKL